MTSVAEHGRLPDSTFVRGVRASAVRWAEECGRADLADDAALVISELVTNAFLHGRGCRGVDVSEIEDGLRVEVRDRSRIPPVVALSSDEALTGRGLRLIAGVADQWGADLEAEGKVVWVELTGRKCASGASSDESDLLARWDNWEPAADTSLFHVELGDVPTDLLIAAKSHVDNLVREFELALAGARAGLTAEIPTHLAALVPAVVERFADARVAIKHQALEAARRGSPTTRLTLDLPGSAANAAEEYLQALDEVDSYCRARRLLTLETPAQHRLFRQWYIGELVVQLRAAAARQPVPEAQSFEQRLLEELDGLTAAQRVSERAARLFAVARALASAATPEAVAEAVLVEGVAALGAHGGGILLATELDTLSLPGTVGYDDQIVARLRSEKRDAELPAAMALRTGDAVWLESRSECEIRFPELGALEAGTAALCAVPLGLDGRRLGALRFSFSEGRLFDDDERRFVLALAALSAQALDRAQLQRARVDVSRRLQRSLLPPTIPKIPGLDVAAMYRPFGDGIEVGGDFYDLWQIGPDRWAIAVGDASGTGPEAAAMTAVVRHTLRALTMSDWEPASVMRSLNTALLAAAEPESDRFCTAVFGVVHTGDPVVVQLASGGHPRPALRRADGRVEFIAVRGTLLGLFAETDAPETQVVLEPDDTLLLFTDGVIEARGPSGMFETAGVVRVLSLEDPTADTTVAALEQAVLQHTGGSLGDDMAAIALHVRR